MIEYYASNNSIRTSQKPRRCVICGKLTNKYAEFLFLDIPICTLNCLGTTEKVLNNYLKEEDNQQKIKDIIGCMENRITLTSVFKLIFKCFMFSCNVHHAAKKRMLILPFSLDSCSLSFKDIFKEWPVITVKDNLTNKTENKKQNDDDLGDEWW